MNVERIVTDRKGVLRAYMRILLLAQRGFSARSLEGEGKKRMLAAQKRLYRYLSVDKLRLGEYQQLVTWIHKQLGHQYTDGENQIWKWHIPESKARRRKGLRWEDAIKQAEENLPDWCHTPNEIKREAERILAQK